MIDLQSQVSGFSVYEPWIHVELDEKPMLFDILECQMKQYMEVGHLQQVLIIHLIREYYQPFIEATELYLSHWNKLRQYLLIPLNF